MELTLHHGDCLEVMKTIPDKSVDLIICDLPYGCLGRGGNGIYDRGEEQVKKLWISKEGNTDALKARGVDWDIKIDLEPFWKEIRRIRRSDHSPTIHFCTTKFGYEIIKSNESEFRYDLVWDKQRGVSFLSANKMPMRSHEMIYIFSKAGAFYERKDITGDFKKSGAKERKEDTSTQYGTKRTKEVKDNTGKRCVLSVVQHPTSTKKGGHPTEKPSDLYKFLIERYCPAGGTLLDPTFGSGNSVFQAFAMGRNAIGIEKDLKFFEKAEERLNALP